MNLTRIIMVSLLLCCIWSCEYNQLEEPINCETEGPSINLVSKTNANCGESDGFVELSATGGAEPFTFSTTSLASQENGSFSNLTAGTYTFVLSDINGCEDELNVIVENVDGVSINTTDLTVASCGGSDGSIQINAAGGTTPYSYKIDEGNFQDESLFTGLTVGTYTVHVLDDGGCEFNEQVEILSGITLSGNVMPIIANNCAVSGCHNGSQSPDLRTADNIIASANRVMARTTAETMPPGGASLTQTQIDEIACWVTDGALNN